MTALSLGLGVAGLALLALAAVSAVRNALADAYWCGRLDGYAQGYAAGDSAGRVYAAANPCDCSHPEGPECSAYSDLMRETADADDVVS